MGKLIVLDIVRAARRACSHVVFYDDDRAARFYGEEFRAQRLYFWTKREAETFAAKHTLNGGPARVEPL